MIYTIGLKDNYEQYFKEIPDLKKKEGGSVWQTPLEAVMYKVNKPGYEVYGVLADWETQTVPSGVGSWNSLTIDAPLVKLHDS